MNYIFFKRAIVGFDYIKNFANRTTIGVCRAIRVQR